MSAETAPRPSNRFYSYILFRPSGVPFYVGKGQGGRCWSHLRGAGKKNTWKDSIIAQAQQNELEIPIVFIAENLLEEEAHWYEMAFIKAIGRFPNGPLVNMTGGGEGVSGLIHSSLTKAKMSRAHKGIRFTEDHRRKLSEAGKKRRLGVDQVTRLRTIHLGKPLTDAHREKLSRIFMGRVILPEVAKKIGDANRGRHHSIESRKKMSQKAKQRHPPTPATRTKMSLARSGKPLSSVQYAKVVYANKQRCGIPRSTEVRAKISAAKLGKPLTQLHRVKIASGLAKYYHGDHK